MKVKMGSALTYIFRTLLILTLSSLASSVSASPKRIHTTYDVEFIKNIELENGQVLKLERATARPFEAVKALHSRIQISDENGDVVAFTPTRITAIPFCVALSECWVFMWKSVYPLPAVFKFDTDQGNWVKEKKPPMIYSRSGYAGEGFVERVNPFFGVFGLMMFLVNNFIFFAFLIFVSIIMFFQIAKYHGLSVAEKKWVRKLLLIANFMIPFVMLPTNPYILTGILICAVSLVGLLFFSIPLVLTVLTSIATFTFLARYQGQGKKLLKKEIV